MTDPAFNIALTNAELNRLTDFLANIGPPAMTFEMLEGYFTALISGPKMVLPSEYLPQIWGEEFTFDNNEQASEVVMLIMRHWNTIASALLQTLYESEEYLPISLVSNEGSALGNDWSLGFLRGIQTQPTGWRELIESEKYGGAMLPIMLLAHEHNPDPEMRPPPISSEKRKKAIEMLIDQLPFIYHFFESHRRELPQTPLREPVRREGPKIGRNDPCPCGSGRKFKRCCAPDAPTLH